MASIQSSRSPFILAGLRDMALAPLDIWAGLITNPVTAMRSQHGNGKPVLLIPGFMAPSLTLAELQITLNLKGYSAYHWDHGINFGPRKISVETVAARVREISQKHNNQAVSIIGHSLGGVYAMGLAGTLEKEALVERVITLGSPVHSHLLSEEKEGINPVMSFIFNQLNSMDDPNVQRFMSNMSETLQGGLKETPVTCIYTHLDGVVGTAVSHTDLEDPLKENVHAFCASHIGMGIAPLARYTIMRRLESKRSVLS